MELRYLEGSFLIQPLQWWMCKNIWFLIHILHILFIVAVGEPWIEFDGACLGTQNSKITTCWSLRNNNLVPGLRKCDRGCSWVGMKIVPESAASLMGERMLIIKLFAISDVRTVPQTIISWLCSLTRAALKVLPANFAVSLHSGWAHRGLLFGRWGGQTELISMNNS